MKFILFFCIIFILYSSVYSAYMTSLNKMKYRFAVVLDKDFARTSLTTYEGGSKFDVFNELKSIWSQLAKEQLGQLPLKVEFHSRADVALRKDLSAVLLIASCKNLWRLYNNSDDAGSLLYLAITEEGCPRLPDNEGITVPLVTRGLEVSQIVSDLRVYQEISWQSLVLITDALLDTRQLRSLLHATGEAQPNVKYTQPKVHHIDLGYFTSVDKELIIQTLREYPNMHRMSNFLVVTSRENTYIVMEAAKSLGLVQPVTQWLYTIAESEFYLRQNDSGLISLLHEGDNIALLINTTRHSGEDKSCAEGGLLCYSRELLRALVAALASGAEVEQRLIEGAAAADDFEMEAISVTERRKRLLNHIKGGIADKLETICDGCMAWKMRSALTWGLKGPAGPNGSENATMIDTGYWRPGIGLSMKEPLFPHVRQGFRKSQVIVVSSHYPPWHEVSINATTGQVLKYTGFIFDVINELASRLNFTYKVVFSANTVRGFAAQGREPTIEDIDRSPDERSAEWEQMIDLVQQNQAFIAAAALSMSAGREMRVNFTLALASQPHSFLIAKPRQMSRTLLFLAPFTANAWFCIWMSIFVVGPVLFVIHRLSYDYLQLFKFIKPGDPSINGGLNKLMNCVWYAYGALLQQGAVHLPKSDSSRVIVGIWWLFVIVIITSYCGNLVAFLTFPRMEPPVTTLNGLLRMKGKLSWGVLRSSGLETLFEDSSVPEYTKILNAAERHAEVDDELLRRVETENHVLLDRRSRLLAIQGAALKNKGYCAFAIANDDFLPEQIGLAMPLQSPYLVLVNKEIRRMQQAGLIDLWLKTALPKRDRCWVTVQSLAAEVNNHAVNLDDMQGSFIVLGMGLVAAFFMLTCERFWKFFLKLRERGLIQPFTN